jgi:hypothetical protein
LVERGLVQKTRPEKSGFFDEFSREIMPLITSKRQKAVMHYMWSVAKDEFKNLLHIMQTSKGRDKIFGLTLYIIDLYIKCRKFAFQSSPFITALRDP